MNYDEMRARVAKAAAMGETIGARLNPDGSYDVLVPEEVLPPPTNDLARASVKRANKGKKWRGVTNELVVAYANPDCKTCGGVGYMGSGVDAGAVCGEDACAENLFAVAHNGRLRFNKSRNRLEVFV